MEEIKDKIETFTIDDIKKVKQFCEELLQNEKDKKRAEEEDNAWDEFVKEYSDHPTVALKLHAINRYYYDVRIWSGYYIGKRDMHITVTTTPDWHEKIFAKTISGNTWFDIDDERFEEGSVNHKVKIPKIDASDLFYHVDCDDEENCEICQRLDDMTYEELEKLLENEEIETCDDDNQIPDEIMMKYLYDHIGENQCKELPEHFEELDY